MVALLGGAAIVGARSFQAAPQADRGRPSQDHVAWVVAGLKRIESIKPGMTRGDLLTVFRAEGGVSTGLQRTFASRDCPYFKVDVEFQAVGWSNRDSHGRITLVEDKRDIILKISKPYLQFTISD